MVLFLWLFFFRCLSFPDNPPPQVPVGPDPQVQADILGNGNDIMPHDHGPQLNHDQGIQKLIPMKNWFLPTCKRHNVVAIILQENN